MLLDPFHVPASIQVPDDFQGIDRSREVTQYKRNLPHYRQSGATYFVTFRLADAIPDEVSRELEAERAVWTTRWRMACMRSGESPPRDLREEYEDHLRRAAIRTEHVLDSGFGACWLADPPLRKIVLDALLHFQGSRLDMYTFAVMPNHVHALFKSSLGYEPENLVGSWKRFTALTIHRLLQTSGQFWQDESWDRIVRHQDHFRRVVRYIARNPTQARLSPRQASVWINPALMSEPGTGLVMEDSAEYQLDPW